ncbi:MAG: hypothetical protein ACYC35_29570 [Pirellulales bacterium]
MRRLSMGVMAVCVLVVNAPAAESWKVYDLPQAGCKAAFPGAPQFDDGTYMFVDGPVKCSLGTAVIRRGGDEARTQWLEGARDNIVKKSSGQLFFDTPMKWNGHYGRHFAFSFSQSGWLWTKDTMIIAVEQRVYVLSVMHLLGEGPADNTEEARDFRLEAVARMFDSFQLVKPVKSTAKPEPQSFPGKWVVVAQEGANQATVGTEYFFYKGKYTARNGRESYAPERGAYEIQGEEESGTIVLQPKFSERLKRPEDFSRRGRWTLKDDTLKILLGTVGEDFPNDLSPKPGSSQVLLTLKRPGDK